MFYCFGGIFVLGGAPGASWGTLGGQVGLQVAFLMVFGVPRGGFGTLCGSSGDPLGALGSHFGTQSRLQGEKKTGSGAHCVPESICAAKTEGPGLV